MHYSVCIITADHTYPLKGSPSAPMRALGESIRLNALYASIPSVRFGAAACEEFCSGEHDTGLPSEVHAVVTRCDYFEDPFLTVDTTGEVFDTPVLAELAAAEYNGDGPDVYRAQACDCSQPSNCAAVRAISKF